MQRIATIKLPAKLSTVSNMLAALDDNLDHRGRLFVAMRSDGLAVSVPEHTSLVPSNWDRRELHK